MQELYRTLDNRTLHLDLCAWTLVLLMFLVTPAWSSDVTGDFSNSYNNSTVDSNNSTEAITNNYNAAGAGQAAPVMSAVSPTMMGGGGNDSCLMPKSAGIQLSIVGVSRGTMQQDEECNLRKNARLLGLPQQMGGLGLQVSAISVLCGSPEVFKAMILASTPCPIMDVVTGKLLMGNDAIERYRSNPEAYIVGYSKEKDFWDSLLRIGEDLADERQAKTETTGRDTRSLSERFRSTRTDRRRGPDTDTDQQP